MALSPSRWLQPSSGSQLFGFDVLSDSIRDSKATPIAPDESRFIAMTPLTAVPCPSVSVTPRLAATSWLAGWMRPANSERFGLMPLSTTPTVTFWPRPPACQALIAPDEVAPFDL
jgi:hypothetical protein